MKKNALPLIAAVMVLLVLGVWLLKPGGPPSAQMPVAHEPISHKEEPSHASKPLNPTESANAKTSLKQMTEILAAFTVQERKLSDLMEALKKAQQEPFQVRDSNQHTGEMIIVRTKSPPQGTRYFHAQYFTDENQQSFAQHMSFEFRPSPEAMDQAIEMVQETFPDLGAPMEETRDFIQWELPHGYVVWVKRLNHEDITNSPFNSYNQGDIGSIRVAIELNPEGEGGH